MKDIFEFSKDREIDGSIALLKNGEKTVCPKGSMVYYQDQLGTVKAMRPACTKGCPFLMMASKKHVDTGEVINGYVLSCQEKQIFITINEPKLTINK